MYGFFNRMFEEHITKKYGKTQWEIIRLEAGVFEESFDEELTYDDNMIIELMDAACELLDITPEDLQTEFGELYFEHCLVSKHGEFLKKIGGNLYDFLSNIDTIHEHISLTYAGAKIPTFRVKQDAGRRSISVQYYSDREQLEYVSKGIIEKASKMLFNLDVNVQIFFDMHPDASTFLITTDDPQKSELMFPHSLETSRDLIPRANEPKVSPLEFSKVFPFHIIFDRNMELVQIGATLRRILKDVDNLTNAPVTEFFEMTRPSIPFTFDSIFTRLNNSFILTTLEKAVKTNSLVLFQNGNYPRRTNVRLKGQMIYIEDRDFMLFLCSPSVSNIEDLRNKGLCLSDIPIHDATRDLVLLSDNIQRERELTEHLRIVRDHLEKIHGELEEEVNLYNRLLFAVLPNSIANRLCDSQPVPAEKFECVTLMFSGIVEFSNLCQELDSSEIVAVLNELYTKFDVLVNFMERFAYKVETVGDKYMTASGLPERVSTHPYVLCMLALDMYDAAKEVIVKGKPISVTFGVHSGEVVAGVIGQKMPRYCLFGNAVNLTSRTETTGVPGKINVTEYTYKLLEENDSFDHFVFERRGEVQMKGKSEPMTTYLLRRADDKSYHCSMSNLSLDCLSLQSGETNVDPVLSSPLNGLGFTLNRTRTTSVISGFRRSRNTSSQTSHYNTPGHSRLTSRYATPLRSRCNSALSTSPYMPSASLTVQPNQIVEADEDNHQVNVLKAESRHLTLGGFERPIFNRQNSHPIQLDTRAANKSDTCSEIVSHQRPTIKRQKSQPSRLDERKAIKSEVLDGLDVCSELSESVFVDTDAECQISADDEDMPSSVSPVMQRKITVQEVLNAINKSLPKS